MIISVKFLLQQKGRARGKILIVSKLIRKNYLQLYCNLAEAY